MVIILKKLMQDRRLKWVLFALWSVILFGMGFTVGNVTSVGDATKHELEATRKLLQLQGDSPERIDATLDAVKYGRLRETGVSSFNIVQLWLPSVLIIMGMLITILSASKKRE